MAPRFVAREASIQMPTLGDLRMIALCTLHCTRRRDEDAKLHEALSRGWGNQEGSENVPKTHHCQTIDVDRTFWKFSSCKVHGVLNFDEISKCFLGLGPEVHPPCLLFPIRHTVATLVASGLKTLCTLRQCLFFLLNVTFNLFYSLSICFDVSRLFE
jgi:hypothetical protein